MSDVPKRSPPRLIEALSIRRVSPRLVRVVFGGPALAGFGPGWPAAHVKLFFPRAHQSVPRLPTLDTQGRPVWPEVGEAPAVRTYSVRRHDPVAQTLDIDFALHELHGPASAWASQAHPGMYIGLAGPGGPCPMLQPADWYLLAGDLSALPALSALLESLDRTARGHVFIQLEDERDKHPLHQPRGVRVDWLITQGAVAACSDLLNTVEHTVFPDGTPQIWLAGENTQVIALRDALLLRFPGARARMYAVPYWKNRQSEEQYHKERHRVMDELEVQ